VGAAVESTLGGCGCRESVGEAVDRETRAIWGQSILTGKKNIVLKNITSGSSFKPL
jgi:hypothetical protein